MKVSLNWLKEYTKSELPIDDLVEKIGSQLGALSRLKILVSNTKGLLLPELLIVSLIPTPKSCISVKSTMAIK